MTPLLLPHTVIMTAQQDLILAVNAGSSSLKLAIFNLSKGQPDACTQLYQASFSNLFTEKPSFTFSSTSVDSSAPTTHSDITDGGNDHKAAFDHFLRHLKTIDFDEQRIKVVGHRVVHGGSMDSPTIIAADTMHRLEELSDLAPLYVLLPSPFLYAHRLLRHNGPALSVIEVCLSSLPSSKSYALFDTSFHHTIPPHIYSYAIDQSIAKAKGLRKYGFHGLSCTSSLLGS
jgi:acetate kinase